MYVYLHTALIITDLQANHAPAEGDVVSIGVLSVHHNEDLLGM